MTQWLAAVGLVICLALAVHMLLPTRPRARVNAAVARLGERLTQALESVRNWRQRRLRERAATDEANELIRRASRRDGEWEGNVYRPKSFEDKDKRKLH